MISVAMGASSTNPEALTRNRPLAAR